MSKSVASARGASIVVCACAGLLAACTAHIRQPPPTTDIDEDRYREDIRILASADFEGRRPGTPGEDKTIAFLASQFRRIGLKPGNGDSYLQQVPVVESTLTESPTCLVTGRGAPRSLVYKQDVVLWTKRAQPAADLAQSELVFAGYGIVAPEYDWNDYDGIDVRGKTVVVLAGDPGRLATDARIFKGRAMTSYGRPDYKIEAAAHAGASGVLLVDDPEAGAFPWDVLVNTRTGPQLAAATADDGAHEPAIEGWLSAAAARALFTQAGLDFAGLATAAAGTGFHARPLGLKLDAHLSQVLRRFTTANVVAMLPGSRRRHEAIIYSAHWDHLGTVTGASGDTFYPGAADDAAGVAGLLGIAQSFKHTVPPPERTILFLAFTGEESGLLGSQFYVDHPVVPLADTVADINLGLLHIGGPTRDVTVIGFGQSELEGNLREVASLQGRELKADPRPESGEYYRADNYSFARAGVPALVAMGGVDDSARGPLWGQAQLDDYYAHRYHRTTDQYTDAWDVRGTTQDLTLYYRLGMRLAQSRRFPNWYAASEFRAARERSRDSGD
jgi:Zn-dependent M28 family amino/carboxypeptidase